MLQMAAQVARAAETASAASLERVWAEARPWAQRLLVQGGPKFAAVATLLEACDVPVYRAGTVVGACMSLAMVRCDVCGRLSCLNHARIDQFGDAICYLCVADAVRARRGGNGAGPHDRSADAPPSADDVRWAAKHLGLKLPVTKQEVREAHRRESARWHPDKHSGAAAKAKAEQRFKDVQRASDILGRHLEQTT